MSSAREAILNLATELTPQQPQAFSLAIAKRKTNRVALNSFGFRSIPPTPDIPGYQGKGLLQFCSLHRLRSPM